MAGATQPQRTDQRKRNRKRKRRNVSISSSSESSDSSDSSSDEQVVKMPTKTSKAPPLHESSSSSSSSSEDESSESEHDESHSARKFQSTSSQAAAPSNAQDEILPPASGSTNLHTRPPSPPPLRNVPAPQLIPQRDAAGNLSSADSEKDKELKDKFRKFWMSSIADAFSDDLNEIRKVHSSTASPRSCGQLY